MQESWSISPVSKLMLNDNVNGRHLDDGRFFHILSKCSISYATKSLSVAALKGASRHCGLENGPVALASGLI